MPAIPMKASKIMDGGIYKTQADVFPSLVQQWTQLTTLKLPFVRYYVQTNPNMACKLTITNKISFWMVTCMWTQAKCSTLMRMPEEEYLKSNLRTSNNGKVEFLSCGFSSISKLVTHNQFEEVGVSLQLLQVVIHSSHQLCCRPSEFALCTFWKQIRLLKRREETSLHILR